MKISIENFKSIGSLKDFELKPLTILSGNNSSGKSSFIQLLLILKQTLDIGSSKKQIFTQGEYYRVKNQKDLIKGKDVSKELKIEFLISKSEFTSYGELVQKSLFDDFPSYSCKLELTFGFIKNQLQIKTYFLRYETDIKTEFLRFVRHGSDTDVSVETNNEFNFLIADRLNQDDSNSVRNINKVYYSSFFPTSFEEMTRNYDEDREGNSIYSDTVSVIKINSDAIRSFLDIYTRELFYIGPLRIEPQDSYSGNIEKDWVGIKGEFTAQLLETLQGKEIDCNIPIFRDESIEFRLEKMHLLDAINFWICNVFGFASKIEVKESGDSYSIILVNEGGIETTVKHVGFGISQILPIIVQGLIMDNGATLILEQPEIHLHPKIQSYLFDFLYSLMLQGKKFIIETHSDHFITRLRRRVAEDESSQLLDQINLTFIEKSNSELKFRKVELDEFGVYNIFPDDFIENPEKELMALLNAQMRKRKAKRK